MTKDFEYDDEEQELDDNKQSYTLYENSTYMVVSKVAYLIGVPKAIFESMNRQRWSGMRNWSGTRMLGSFGTSVCSARRSSAISVKSARR